MGLYHYGFVDFVFRLKHLPFPLLNTHLGPHRTQEVAEGWRGVREGKFLAFGLTIIMLRIDLVYSALCVCLRLLGAAMEKERWGSRKKGNCILLYLVI